MSEGESGDLAARPCAPCRGGVPPLAGDALRALASKLPSWRIAGEHHLERSFSCPDFRAALAFVNRAGALLRL